MLLIPIYLYFFVSRRQRFEALRLEIKGSESDEELFVLEKKVNLLIENRKIKTLHGLILRNTIEERENSIRESTSLEPKSRVRKKNKRFTTRYLPLRIISTDRFADV